jgi:hypothetical protein
LRHLSLVGLAPVKPRAEFIHADRLIAHVQNRTQACQLVRKIDVTIGSLTSHSQPLAEPKHQPAAAGGRDETRRAWRCWASSAVSTVEIASVRVRTVTGDP